MKKWKCTVCGYIHVGDEPPEECPVCGADETKFVEVTEEVQQDLVEEKSSDKTEGMFDKLVGVMLKNHLHPITVHTPNGIAPAAFLFLFAAVAFNMSSFEIPAFYNLIFVLLAMPVVLFSGYIEWQKHYQGAKTSVFYTKISCGVVVLTGSAVLVAWRFVNPQVAGPESPSKWIYLLLCMVVLAAVGLAGHLGGKLVFGKNK